MGLKLYDAAPALGPHKAAQSVECSAILIGGPNSRDGGSTHRVARRHRLRRDRKRRENATESNDRATSRSSSSMRRSRIAEEDGREDADQLLEQLFEARSIKSAAAATRPKRVAAAKELDVSDDSESLEDFVNKLLASDKDDKDDGGLEILRDVTLGLERA